MADNIRVDYLDHHIVDFRELVEMEGMTEKIPAVDAYLVIGDHAAALIDTLESAEGLYEEVRKITDLPVTVLITHGHGDHAGASLKEFADTGCPIYMSMLDYPCLCAMNPTVQESWFHDLSAGQCFNLGGRTLKTILCPGHTEKSVVFLEEENQLLFSGDAIGSGGFWMQIPGCRPLKEFDETLRGLCTLLKPYEHLVICPGHRYQSPGTLNITYAEDVLQATDQIIDGTLTGEDMTMEIGGMTVRFKKVSFQQVHDYCYNPHNI